MSNLQTLKESTLHNTRLAKMENLPTNRHNSIGAGFFVGSGGALNTGGPGSVLIGFLIMGVMMFNVVYALGELAVMYPVSGGFYT